MSFSTASRSSSRAPTTCYGPRLARSLLSPSPGVRGPTPNYWSRPRKRGGLGAFAVAGALAAINTGQGWSGAALMAILTATGGGVIRDLLANRVPLVLHSEVNATAAGLGGLVTWAAVDMSSGVAALLGLSVTALVRAAGMAFDLHLPRPRRSGGNRPARDV